MAEGKGNCLTPWDYQGRRVYSSNGAFPTLYASENSGQQQQAVLLEAIDNPERCKYHAEGYCKKLRGDSLPFLPYCIPYTLFQPISFGFKLGNGEKARSIGFEEEKSQTLNAESGWNKPAVLLRNFTYQDVTGCLSPGAHPGSYNGQDAYNDMLVTEPKFCQNTGVGWWNQTDVGATLRTPCGGDATKANLVCEQKCFGICSYASNSMKSDNPHSGIYEADTSRTLDLNGGNPACNQGGIAGCEQTIYDMTHANDVIRDCGAVSPTLQSRMGTGGNQVPLTVQRIIRWIVRRLTPMECERLQGYPDHWTDIGDWVDSEGKKHKGDADSPRYKALGNSIALPFWCWMFCRMAKFLPEHATLGSLFDGIGGFPLCWEAIHGKGTARWASEIEEFPIAVTKIRFPEE